MQRDGHLSGSIPNFPRQPAETGVQVQVHSEGPRGGKTASTRLQSPVLHRFHFHPIHFLPMGTGLRTSPSFPMRYPVLPRFFGSASMMQGGGSFVVLSAVSRPVLGAV